MMWSLSTVLTTLALAGPAQAAMRGSGLDDFLPERIIARAEWRAAHQQISPPRHEARSDWRAAQDKIILPRQGPDMNGTHPNATTTYRYRSNATEQYLIESLPEVDFDFGEMYSGLIPIDPSNSSEGLFFVFAPKAGGAPVDEVTIWLNGGPGCSSLMGWFQENGPISWQPGTFKPVENPYAWTNLTNMLWIEQPVGTGFSIGTPNATDEIPVAENFLNWFKEWQAVFGISNYKIYITGESYAGRYVPYIASAMLSTNDTEHFNVSGILVYDPVIGEFDYGNQVVAYPFIEANRNLFGAYNQTDMDTLKAWHEGCGFQQYLDTYFTFPPSGPQPPTAYPANKTCHLFGIIDTYAAGINPCFNPYSINDRCPLPHDPLGHPAAFDWTDPGSTIYFQRPDVIEAMHAPGPELVNWTLCSEKPVFTGGQGKGPQRRGDLSPDPIQHVLPHVIEKTGRAMVVNGDWDMVIMTNQTLLSIQNMTWNGAMGFQSAPNTSFIVEQVDLAWIPVYEQNWKEPNPFEQGLMGVSHYERGLMWVETYMSGHMVPMFQPRAAYKQAQWLLGHIETL